MLPWDLFGSPLSPELPQSGPRARNAPTNRFGGLHFWRYDDEGRERLLGEGGGEASRAGKRRRKIFWKAVHLEGLRWIQSLPKTQLYKPPLYSYPPASGKIIILLPSLILPKTFLVIIFKVFILPLLFIAI